MSSILALSQVASPWEDAKSLYSNYQNLANIQVSSITSHNPPHSNPASTPSPFFPPPISLPVIPNPTPHLTSQPVLGTAPSFNLGTYPSNLGPSLQTTPNIASTTAPHGALNPLLTPNPAVMSAPVPNLGLPQNTLNPGAPGAQNPQTMLASNQLPLTTPNPYALGLGPLPPSAASVMPTLPGSHPNMMMPGMGINPLGQSMPNLLPLPPFNPNLPPALNNQLFAQTLQQQLAGNNAAAAAALASGSNNNNNNNNNGLKNNGDGPQNNDNNRSSPRELIDGAQILEAASQLSHDFALMRSQFVAHGLMMQNQVEWFHLLTGATLKPVAKGRLIVTIALPEISTSLSFSLDRVLGQFGDDDDRAVFSGAPNPFQTGKLKTHFKPPNTPHSHSTLPTPSLPNNPSNPGSNFNTNHSNRLPDQQQQQGITTQSILAALFNLDAFESDYDEDPTTSTSTTTAGAPNGPKSKFPTRDPSYLSFCDFTDATKKADPDTLVTFTPRQAIGCEFPPMYRHPQRVPVRSLIRMFLLLACVVHFGLKGDHVLGVNFATNMYRAGLQDMAEGRGNVLFAGAVELEERSHHSNLARRAKHLNARVARGSIAKQTAAEMLQMETQGDWDAAEAWIYPQMGPASNAHNSHVNPNNGLSGRVPTHLDSNPNPFVPNRPRSVPSHDQYDNGDINYQQPLSSRNQPPYDIQQDPINNNNNSQSLNVDANLKNALFRAEMDYHKAQGTMPYLVQVPNSDNQDQFNQFDSGSGFPSRNSNNNNNSREEPQKRRFDDVYGNNYDGSEQNGVDRDYIRPKRGQDNNLGGYDDDSEDNDNEAQARRDIKRQRFNSRAQAQQYQEQQQRDQANRNRSRAGRGRGRTYQDGQDDDSLSFQNPNDQLFAQLATGRISGRDQGASNGYNNLFGNFGSGFQSFLPYSDDEGSNENESSQSFDEFGIDLERQQAAQNQPSRGRANNRGFGPAVAAGAGGRAQQFDLSLNLPSFKF